MSIVRIQRKGQMTLPSGVRTAVGLADGDLVDVRVTGRKIVITPTLAIDRSQFPTADDEYTPEQRRIIDARLDRADADIKAGRVSKAFESHEACIADLHKGAGKYTARKNILLAKRSSSELPISRGFRFKNLN